MKAGKRKNSNQEKKQSEECAAYLVATNSIAIEVSDGEVVKVQSNVALYARRFEVEHKVPAGRI